MIEIIQKSKITGERKNASVSSHARLTLNITWYTEAGALFLLVSWARMRILVSKPSKSKALASVDYTVQSIRYSLYHTAARFAIYSFIFCHVFLNTVFSLDG